VSDTPSGFGDLPPELDPRGRGGRPGATRTGRRRGLGRLLTPWRAPASTLARRTPGQRVIAWVAATVSLVVLVTAGGFWVIYHSIFGNIAHIDAFDALAKNGIHRPAEDTKAQNFLLVGSDTRAGDDASYNAAKGSPDYTSGERSDTMMLVHVPTGPAKASIISFPRDSWVDIPQWTDTKGAHHPAHMDKLNAAFSEGGAPLLVATLEQLSGIRVDHVVQIDFTGFKNMVNALGGITVCVKTTRHDHDSGDNLTAGSEHHINGDQALAFVRDRKGLPGGDIERIADQQYFLSVVLHKVLSAGTLTNPAKLFDFATAAAKSMTTDKGFGITAMKTLATRLHDISPAHVTFLQVPILNSNAREGSQSVVALDMADLPAVFAAMKDNTAAPKLPTATVTKAAPTKPAAPLIVRPAAIRLRVSNGSGRAHLAAQTAEALKNLGFTAITSGNAASTPTSIVYYGTGYADSARTLAAAVPGSVVKLKTTLGRTLELIIGDNFTTTQAVTVGKASPTTTAAAPKATTTAAVTAAIVAKAPTAASASCAP
jgi:LCP family protein required for cell wall assembly